jgi:hypothetical protein
MARPKKQTASKAEVELQILELARVKEIEALYKDLANVKHAIDIALTKIGFIDSCETLSEAAFKAGRAYGPLDQANDKLAEMLSNLYDSYDLEHWDDILEN